MTSSHPVQRIGFWAYWLARGWWSSTKIRLGYWLRPYDDILDARRWRWQERGQCGTRTFAALSTELQRSLTDAALQLHEEREVKRTEKGPST